MSNSERRRRHVWLVRATCQRIFRQLGRDPNTIIMAIMVPSALVILVRFVLDSEAEFNTSAPPLIAIFPFSVMFLVTSIATLRERLAGTLERLMTLSVARIDLLLGYVLAFGVVAAAQVILVVSISGWWLGLTIDGSVLMVLLVAMLNAVLGIAFGLLGSAISRTEYQVVQLLPIFVLPQVLICGLFVPKSSMAPALEALSKVLPLPQGVEAMNDVVGDTANSGTIAEGVLIIAGYTAVTLIVGAATLQRMSGNNGHVVRRLLDRVRVRRSRMPTVRHNGRVATGSTPSWFELYQDTAGWHRFRLRNGQRVLAVSPTYATQEEAEEAISAMCEGMLMAERSNGTGEPAQP